MGLKEKAENRLERAAEALDITTLEQKVTDSSFTVQEVFGIKTLLKLDNEKVRKLFGI